MGLKEATDKNFDEIINTDVPVVIDFWAPWCGPCKALTPIMEDLDKEMGADVNFYKLNVDESPLTAGKYSIMSIPTVLIMKNGEIQKQIVGLVSKAKLKKDIEACK